MNCIMTVIAFLGLYNQQESPFGWNEGAFEWKIFDKISKFSEIGSSVKVLNKFCESIHLPWKYKAKANPAICYWHFKMFFQFVCPLRIATVDGQH